MLKHLRMNYQIDRQTELQKQYRVSNDMLKTEGIDEHKKETAVHGVIVLIIVETYTLICSQT